MSSHGILPWAEVLMPTQTVMYGSSSGATCSGDDSSLDRRTVGGRNPAPVDRWFYPIIYRVSTIQGGAGFLPSTVG